jgi:hypothetical protein
MKKKNRIDTASELVAALKSQKKKINPPPGIVLRPCDEPFWISVIEARSKEEWSDHSLIAAAHLARCMADIERVQVEVDQEGDVILNHRGTPIANPKHKVMQDLCGRKLAIERSLQLHAKAEHGNTRDVAKRREKIKQAEQDIERYEDDDLLGGSLYH